MSKKVTGDFISCMFPVHPAAGAVGISALFSSSARLSLFVFLLSAGSGDCAAAVQHT